MKDDKQGVTIHIAISLPIKEAETLAEFLSDLINRIMGKEAIVSYTKDIDEDESLVLKGPTLDDLMKE